VIHLEHFSFLKEEKHEAKFYRGYQQPGSYALALKLFSDCYYGLDLESSIKFVVREEKKAKEVAEPEEKEDLDEDDTLFGKIMKMLTLPEEEELSDTEDDAAKKKGSRKEEQGKTDKDK
jgi:hypothetical protein